MTWFKIDDGFWSHPKTATLSDSAVALWVRAGAYSCQHLTDGTVPENVLRLLGGTPEFAAELVESGLWKSDRRGWRFHDWSEYQETADDVKARREQAKERMRKAREAKRRSQNVRANTQRTTGERSGEVREKFARSDGNPDPTRPDPTRPPISGHLEGEGLDPARATGRPSDRCRRHEGETLPPPCGGCADARRAAEAYDREARRAAVEAEQEARAAQADVERAAIDDCHLCDTRGYRAGRVCDHDPAADERNQAGIALVRATLEGRGIA